MALTKINFYLIVIFVVILIFVGMDIVGTSLVDSDRISLDSESVDYILEVKGLNSQSGYTGISNTSSAESQLDDPLDSGNSSVSDSNDFLSTLYIKKERASAPTNYFKLIYNIPSSLIRGVGLDISDWTNYINIISYLIFISLILLLWIKVINT